MAEAPEGAPVGAAAAAAPAAPAESGVAKAAEAAGLRSLVLPISVTLLVQTLVAVAVYSAPVMAPVAGPDLGLQPSTVGYFIALVYLGSMFGSLTGGGLVARYGPIRISQIGLGLCLAGLALAAATSWLVLVAVGAILIGLGYGPSTPASSQILVRATPPSMISITFSVKQTGVPLGGMIAGALVPTLVLATSWRWAALVIGLGCVALAFAIQPARRHYDTTLNAVAPVSLRAAFAPLAMITRDPRLAEMAIISFVYAGVQITLVAYLVTFLTESFQLTLVMAGFVMAVSQVASVIGRVLWGVVADHMLTRRGMLGLLGLGMGFSAMVTLAASPAWPLWLLFTFAAVFGATAVGWNGVFLAEVARVAPPGQTSQATGACMFFTFLGVVVTPPLFSLVLSLGGSYSLAYALFGLPAILVAVRLFSKPRTQAA